MSCLGTKPSDSALLVPHGPRCGPQHCAESERTNAVPRCGRAPTLPTPLDTFLENVSGATDAMTAAVGAALVGTASTALVGTAAAAATTAALGSCLAVAASLAAAPLAVALVAAASIAAIVMATVASGLMTATTALVVAAVASASRLVLATIAAFSARVALLGDTEELKPNSLSCAVLKPWLLKTVTMPP